MNKLIPLINEIHDILDKSQLGNQLRLPQVVVIGSQSTGKSSVLESIIGKEFLPRGKGIVTRRPIEIQLSNIPESSHEKDWAEFFDKKGQKIYDFEELRNLIQDETDKLCGQNKGVSYVPLRLKVFSKDVVDLMLVDLPGMTKNPVGDQPQDIEKQIMDLLNPYVQNPNSLILAVSRGSDDLANSESLKLARTVDPEGNRTVGVITQLDIMDQGCDALNDLMGKTYPLKLGYIGVVMRGQKEIQQRMTIQQQYLKEKKFFEESEIYKKIADKMGVPYLVKSLNYHFMNHIKQCLPEIRENLIKQIMIKEAELKNYGEFDELEDNKSRGLFVLNMLAKFCQSYKDLVEGKYLRSGHDQLIGGSRINYIFSDIFRKSLNDIDPFEILNDDEIRTAIKNANGLRPSLFVPEGAFENLVKQQISRLLQPSLQCSKLVYEEQRRILTMINIPEIERFDNLNSGISEVMEQVLSRCQLPTDQMIKNLIEIELGYINTSHPDFCGGIGLLQATQQEILNKDEQPPNQMNEKGGKNQKQQQNQQKQSQQQQQNNSSQQKKQSQDGASDENSLYGNDPRFNDQNGRQDENGFWSWFSFSSRQQSKQTELTDNKLNNMHFKKKRSTQNSNDEQNKDGKSNKYSDMLQPSAYNEDYSINNLGSFMPKTQLPHVPSQIKLGDNYSKKEQTETKMIKNLIISYYNVVKKNISDSVPKTIITFLTNRSVNICERELVSSLYKEDQLEELLKENSFVLEQRKETKSQLKMLKQCLNILNDTESKC
ncbi:P-loop containing nucleoside triphosphate hydrolase [Pseudocohnilembus persalinus]|uniref:p-loop containing nucleoside triphosphate hydrolase n=1 Tax=Pseudocohnilembus persalinus TaxID=266149 RepID=A0A0V0R0T4_PSEPJ|nr:P-loop containing nucleoside triphosphate hydrolase [Pseudocohnilembus persalinus]|eukprot:KRX07898.1 P-loop containing nucleoside triphosphate hydrolase [Pseudocohnilembus persalinus]